MATVSQHLSRFDIQHADSASFASAVRGESGWSVAMNIIGPEGGYTTPITFNLADGFDIDTMVEEIHTLLDQSHANLNQATSTTQEAIDALVESTSG